jgi:hypothetical protein
VEAPDVGQRDHQHNLEAGVDQLVQGETPEVGGCPQVGGPVAPEAVEQEAAGDAGEGGREPVVGQGAGAGGQ